MEESCCEAWFVREILAWKQASLPASIQLSAWMEMHIMYAGPYYVGFSVRGSECWFHYVYGEGGVGWVLSGKVHKRTVFGNVALVLINQGFPLDSNCCLAAFLQSSVRVVKFCRNRSFSWLGCVVVLVEQRLEHGWSTVWGTVWTVWPWPCTLLRTCKNVVVVCDWGSHTCWCVADMHGTECDAWKIGDWAMSASPRFWELSFRKMEGTLQTLSGLDGSSLKMHAMLIFVWTFVA